MGFQSTVSIQQGFGVPGEQFSNGPWRAQPFTIESALASYNNIGSTMCTVTAQGFCQAGRASASAPLAGLLVDPKNIALFGAGGQPLNPTLNVPNFTAVECATMGSFVVTLPAAAAIGDKVIFDNTTGAISTISTAPFQLTGITTSASATITMGNTTGVFAGQPVSGAGIPVGAVVNTVTLNTSIVISIAATASATVPLTFTPSGNNLPAGKSFADAAVDYYAVSGAGLAVITLTPATVIPA
jgi:hypothetical protein